MTEINLFPKQLQSVAALAFIAVLIVLLLILTVSFEILQQINSHW